VDVVQGVLAARCYPPLDLPLLPDRGLPQVDLGDGLRLRDVLVDEGVAVLVPPL
jgi:hypothetical protein